MIGKQGKRGQHSNGNLCRLTSELAIERRSCDHSKLMSGPVFNTQCESCISNTKRFSHYFVPACKFSTFVQA